MSAEVEGYVVVSHAYDCAEMRVDSFSGFGGDIYATLEEAEEIRGLTSATMAIHKPEMRYHVAELHLLAAVSPREGDGHAS